MKKLLQNKKLLWIAGGAILILAGTLIFTQGQFFQGYLTKTQPTLTPIQTTKPQIIPKITACTLSASPYYTNETITATLSLVTEGFTDYTYSFNDGKIYVQPNLVYPVQGGETNGSTTMKFEKEFLYTEAGDFTPKFSGNLINYKLNAITLQTEKQETPFTATCNTITVGTKKALAPGQLPGSPIISKAPGTPLAPGTSNPSVSKTPPTATGFQISCTADTTQANIGDTVTWTATTADLGSNTGTMTFIWNGTATNNDSVKRTILSKSGVYTGTYQNSYSAVQSDLGMTVSATYTDTFKKTLTGSATCSPTIDIVSQSAKTFPQSAYFSFPEATPDPWNPETSKGTFQVTLNNLSSTNEITAQINKGIRPQKIWTLTNTTNGVKEFEWDGIVGSGIISPNTYTFEVSGTDGLADITPVSITFEVIETPTPATPAGGSSGSNSSGSSSGGNVTTIANQNLCAGFEDITKLDPDCKAFTYAKSIGALTGNDDGTLRPDDHLQRDQIAKIVTEALYQYDNKKDYANNRNPFPDVTDEDWSYQYVTYSKQNGIVTGYIAGTDAGFYRPARNITRAEFLTLILRAIEKLDKDEMPSGSLQAYSDTATGQWYSPYARYSKENNLFTGNYLYPTTSVTRREVAQTLYKLNQLEVI